MSDQNTTEPRKIIINLNNSREASRLEKNEIIQQEALDQFKRLITQIKDRIEDFKKHLESDDPIRAIRTHDVITVDGRRGSGKTTFILSAFESLEDKIKKDICFLDIIDPTLIETREHVFVTIVSLIKRRVDDAHQKSRAENNEKKYKVWRKSLEELANGMRLLDGIGQNHLKSDSWMDEHFALEHGIQNAQSGRDLEQSFHRYIAASLDFIGHKAFLIAFDDIDTDFSKGWPVLEMIRKYITTPQLITVLSGDLQLYSTLVEKQQWKNLGLGFDTDKEKQTQFKPMVEELVDQYLLKILRTPNRIELKSIGHYVDNTPYGIGIIRRGDSTEQDIKQVLKNICTEVLSISQNEIVNRAIEQLVTLPTRTMVSLLFSIENYTDISWNIARSFRKEASGFDHQIALRKNRLSAILALSDVFLTWLQKIDYRRQDFEQNDTQKAISQLLQRLINQDLLPEAAKLKPSFTRQEHNNAMFILSAFFAHSMEDTPKSYFDYMLHISLTASSMQEFHDELFTNKISKHENVALNDKDKLDLYVRHLGLMSGSSSLNIARKYISFMWPNNIQPSKNKLAIKNGTLQLYSDTSKGLNKIKYYLYSTTNKPIFEPLENFRQAIDKRKNASLRGFFFNTATTLHNNITSWHKYIAMLPISINRSGDGTFTHFSFFNLLGAIAELMEADDLQNQFEKSGFVREYPTFSGETSHQEENEDSFEIEPEVDSKDDTPIIPDDFKKMFNKWESSMPQGESTTTPDILTKAWTRFFFAIKMLPEEFAKSKNKSECFAGIIMHRWIVLFLNSFLVEEGACSHIFNLRQNNPISSDKIFLDNLISIYGPLNDGEERLTCYPDQIPLFEWLFSCPLWSFFLDDDTNDEVYTWHNLAMKRMKLFEFYEEYDEYVDYIHFNEDEDTISLFDVVNSLAIVGMKQDKAISQNLGNEEVIDFIKINSSELKQKWEQSPKDLSYDSVYSFLVDLSENDEVIYQGRISSIPKTFTIQIREKILTEFIAALDLSNETVVEPDTKSESEKKVVQPGVIVRRRKATITQNKDENED